MPVAITSAENRTIGVYSSTEIDAMVTSGTFVGTGAPPGVWNKITLGFQPKCVLIHDWTNGLTCEATREVSGAIPPPMGAPPDAIVTAGIIHFFGGPPAPAWAGILLAPDGFYVDAFFNAAVPIDYHAFK